MIQFEQRKGEYRSGYKFVKS